MELLVRTKDKTSSDASFNIQLTKRGDVIAIKPDGSDWGIQELLNPEWVLLSVPDLTEEQASLLLSSEIAPKTNPNAPTMKRAMSIDLDSLLPLSTTGTLSRSATFDADQQPITDLQFTAIDISAATITKPASIDPLVIGPIQSDTIG